MFSKYPPVEAPQFWRELGKLERKINALAEALELIPQKCCDSRECTEMKFVYKHKLSAPWGSDADSR